MSRQSFIAGMASALGRRPALTNGHPNLADLTAYFQTLRGNPQGALNALREYVRSFYIHVQRAIGPTADVTWPGGSCDQWDELVARPRRQHRRVIDCEGYALIGDELLTAAGWDFMGYLVAYLPTQTDPSEFHIMSVMEYPGEPTRRVYIGSDRLSTSWLAEAYAVWPDGAQNARTGGYADTALEAIQRVQRQIERGEAREVAPLRQPRSVAPPLMSD